MLALWSEVLSKSTEGSYNGVAPISTGLWTASVSTTVVALALSLTIYARWAIAVGAYHDRLDQERGDQLRGLRDKASPQAGTELTHLLETNRALLDDYQRPVRAQARSSYTLSQVAIIAGLLVLAAGIIVTLAAADESARIGIAALSALGAALSGYIARTFLRLYERAQDQLNFYFREPLVTSYLLAAERLAEKLEGDKREEAYSQMISEIVRALGGDLTAGAGSSRKLNSD
jgi:hypothetical protein